MQSDLLCQICILVKACCPDEQSVDQQKLKDFLKLQLVNLQQALLFEVLQCHTFSLASVWGSFGHLESGGYGWQ